MMVKEKALQLVLREEVSPDASTAQRSQVTGHLVLTMPKVAPVLKSRDNHKTVGQIGRTGKPQSLKADKGIGTSRENNGGRQILEVDPRVKTCVDVSNIVNENKSKQSLKSNPVGKPLNTARLKAEEDFVDDPDVPPLI